MRNLIDVCALDDLPVYSGSTALVDDKQIALFRLDEGDTVLAIDNYDPIGQAQVLSRGIIVDVEGLPVVASPLYKQHFCLQTGVCLQDKSVKVQAYPVTVEDGRVKLAA